MIRFEVDREHRTVAGLIVPFGEPTHVPQFDGTRYLFSAGVLSWPEDVSKIKLRIQHQPGSDVGHALELTEVAEGVYGKFSVARGPEGDKALSMAEDKVWDGFSIGLRDNPTFKRTKGKVAAFTAAVLAETSLTPDPAFSSARVAAVVAEAPTTEGSLAMDEDEDETPTIEAPVGFDMQAFVAALRENLPGPEPVSPTEPLGFETDESPYVFDAARGTFGRGDHDFSTDVIASAQGDREAGQRVQEFIRTQFAIDSGDVASLNPNRQRPDMYVDQRQYQYPLWNAVNKGSLADSTPFVFPKFKSAGTLVADHVEGVEPTAGDFEAESQTVTPKPVSGKVSLPREVWDAGGNPQVSGLVWRQMVRAYNEALEGQVVTTLAAAAASITDIGLTTAAVNDALVGEVLDAFASLQFVRGGFTMDTFALHVDLYKRLAAAKDSTGRKLLPYLNPSNASGSSSARLRTLDIQGVEGIPSWALGAASANSSNSWLFDRESVHGWASAPQRLDFSYRVAFVDIAIWGYKAVAISDTSGVRQVTYDPTA